mmetsp:Transcript_12929/g.26897  ORF Transcript_12929/g.26897 Transcript_12929/m.26897 type:complete len:218 (+) Transcript_12929:1107-1760(+)
MLHSWVLSLPYDGGGTCHPAGYRKRPSYLSFAFSRSFISTSGHLMRWPHVSLCFSNAISLSMYPWFSSMRAATFASRSASGARFAGAEPCVSAASSASRYVVQGGHASHGCLLSQSGWWLLPSLFWHQVQHVLKCLNGLRPQPFAQVKPSRPREARMRRALAAPNSHPHHSERSIRLSSPAHSENIEVTNLEVCLSSQPRLSITLVISSGLIFPLRS